MAKPPSQWNKQWDFSFCPPAHRLTEDKNVKGENEMFVLRRSPHPPSVLATPRNAILPNYWQSRQSVSSTSRFHFKGEYFVHLKSNLANYVYSIKRLVIWLFLIRFFHFPLKLNEKKQPVVSSSHGRLTLSWSPSTSFSLSKCTLDWRWRYTFL